MGMGAWEGQGEDRQSAVRKVKCVFIPGSTQVITGQVIHAGGDVWVVLRQDTGRLFKRSRSPFGSSAIRAIMSVKVAQMSEQGQIQLLQFEMTFGRWVS